MQVLFLIQPFPDFIASLRQYFCFDYTLQIIRPVAHRQFRVLEWDHPNQEANCVCKKLLKL